MFDVIAIGSATKDIFIDAKKLKKGDGFSFSLGEKIELEEILSFSGGGGVNAAATFSQQGLKTAFCGVVGQDLAGQEILEELNQKGVDTELVKVKSSALTDIGLIFHAAEDRTILLYHGASRSFSEKDVDWEKLKESEWFYLAPLWAKAGELCEKLVSFAKENNIKTAFNPSLSQLSLPQIRKIIKDVNVLILNDEESAFLAGEKSFDEEKTFSALAEMTSAVIVVTRGKEGATALANGSLYQIKAPPTKVADATGAGDSFGSGFVAGLIQKKSLENSLKLAMANAVANISVFGANQGLLKKNDELPEIELKKVVFK